MTEVDDLRPDPEPKPAVPPVTPGQVELYLKVHNAKRPCEACGNGTWECYPEGKDSMCATLGFARLDDLHSRTVHPVIILVCRNCNAVRIFMRGPIVAWIRSSRGA